MSHKELVLIGNVEGEHSKKHRWTDEPLRLVHHHPGYLRARADAFVGAEENSPVLTAAKKAAEGTPGVLGWSHNPKTGSIVLNYIPGLINTDDLLKHVAKKAGLNGFVEDLHSTAHRKELVHGFMDAVQEVNRIVEQSTGGKADLRELVPLALAATSVVAFIQGDDRGRLPSWDSAIYHSYRIFMQWHRREVRKREKKERSKEHSDDGP